METTTIKLDQGTTEEAASHRIAEWLLGWASRTLKIERDRLDADTVFMELGVDSVDAIYMLSDLEAMLDVKLETELLIECPTARALSTRVAQVWATRS